MRRLSARERRVRAFYALAACALAVPVGVTALLKLRDAGRLAAAPSGGGLSAWNHAAIPRRPGSSRLVPLCSNSVTGDKRVIIIWQEQLNAFFSLLLSK